MSAYPLTMYGLRELEPGPRWAQLHRATWPGYRRFYLSEGRSRRPGLATAAAALLTYMPELAPVWAKLSRQVDFDDDSTAFLTQWGFPRFAPAGCSQVVTGSPAAGLVRNYDYAPHLFEQVSVSTDYLQPVIGTSDCLWGLLDGMNRAGLVVSLTFGGDKAYAEGFAIPLVVRYLLETCDDISQAEAALDRLPVAMSYNLTMVDGAARTRTAHLRPGHAPEFADQPFATNHRWRHPVDPVHAATYRSVERLEILDDLHRSRTDADEMASAMLRPPLYSTDYAGGFGTVYTADYRPRSGTVTYRWPGSSWTRHFDSADDTMEVVLNGR